MIRKLQRTDIETVADIWLDTNIAAHSFIDACYWHNHFAAVKEMFTKAVVYVYEDKGQILGFVGMDGNYLAGIFVCGKAQSRGIGKQLLDFVKGMYPKISLHVYQKNLRAVAFYQKQDFKIEQESIEESTGEKEYGMIWKQKK